MKPTVFKCIRSGNFVSFTLEGDIAGMRNHEGYIEMTPDMQEIPKPQEKPAQPVLVVSTPARRGRPRKAA